MQELNSVQRAAVFCTQGSLLVVAGAGSGKTRVITYRILNLLNTQQATANQILALTFTNKAAHEMRERIVGQSEQLPFIGTFHAYCLNLLKKYGTQIGLHRFSILDGADQEKLVSDLIKRFGLAKANSRQLLYHISQAKNQAAIGEPYPALEYDFQLQELCQRYEAEKRHSNCLDFDDLMIKAVELLNQSEFRSYHQQLVRHVLVDEYQDTSVLQHRLLKYLTLNGDNLGISSVCVVGDEDQSIYSWRGANVDNILQFPREFPQVQVVKIEQNYRSANSILEVANLLIQNNSQRNPKKLWSEKDAKNRVLLLNVVSGYQEADVVANLAQLQARTNNNRTLAVLYRTHFQSRSLEEALLKSGIPYQIIGGIQFYERKEIKDLLAYLKLVVNPRDRVSFARAYNCPPRKLGTQFAEQFFTLWEKEPFADFRQIATYLINDQAALTATKRASLTDFLAIFSVIKPEDAPSAAIRNLVSKLHYQEYLKDTETPEEAQNRIENIHELIRAAEHFETTGRNTIGDFLEEVALLQEQLLEQQGHPARVQLMTLHAAKGLEFDTVVLAGVEEGLIPSNRSLNTSDGLEEERRLMYVGITRAREHLVVIHAKSRNIFGQVNDQAPSRFIAEIGSLVNHKIDTTYLSLTQLQMVLEHFLQGKKIEIPGYFAARLSQSASISSAKIIKNSWRVNQPVKHATFGLGLVQKIEGQEDSTILTIKFRSGVKKISARFVQK